MRNNLISSLAFGLCIFFSLCALLSVNTVLSVQSYSSRIRATFFLTTHTEPFQRDPTQINPIGPKLLKRARRWTPDETELLLELREQQLSWEEINEYFPERTWVAIALKHAVLKRDSSKIKVKKVEPWSNDEHELLLELVKTNTPWVEIAEQLPGRTVSAVKSRYNYLTRGNRLPKSYKAKWTPAEDELLIELEKKKVPWEERVIFFSNRSLSALQYRLKLLLPNPTLVGNYTPEEDEEIIEGLKSGMSRKEISEMLNRSERGVEKRIRRLEESKRLDPAPQLAKNRHYTSADLERLDRMVKSGMPYKEIAQYFPGRSASGLSKVYNRYKEQKQREEKRI